MIFIDSNIPMYLVGAPHPNKTSGLRLLERLVAAGEHLVTDAEVFQEILHRYVAIDRRDAIEPAFAALLGIVDEIFSVDFKDVERAKTVIHDNVDLSARDALHVAVMARYGVTRILTFDEGFDGVPGMSRISR